jgi:hypothetical protein
LVLQSYLSYFKSDYHYVVRLGNRLNEKIRISHTIYQYTLGISVDDPAVDCFFFKKGSDEDPPVEACGFFLGISVDDPPVGAGF